MVTIVCFFTVESEWKGKTVDKFNFQYSARLHMKGRTRSDAIVRPEDGVVGRTFVIDKVIHELNLGDTIAAWMNLRRQMEILERLGQSESGVGVAADPIRIKATIVGGRRCRRPSSEGEGGKY